jgi:tRNA-specific 2-thiouridylase
MSRKLIDLDLQGPRAETRVVVAMSGGVDSSVTAALVAEAGYDVVGITLQLYDHGEAARRKGACCAGVDIHDARDVADRIGIPHYVLDYESRFRNSVIDDFADSYLRGETPIPCVRCNQTVKFRDLLTTAKDLGAKALCTGHYVQRVIGGKGVELHRGADLAKDQSYFLFSTTKAQLNYLRFPLGHLTKSETRSHAVRLGLDVAEKPDSQDICFVPGGRYADVVKRLRPGAIDPGKIIHVDGTILGKHDGIINYTVGQRKGLGIGGRFEPTDPGDTSPLYVISVDPEEKKVIVGPRSALARNLVMVTQINWIGDDVPCVSGTEVLVKLRSTQEPIMGILFVEDNKEGRLILIEEQFGIASGQAAVFYSSKDKSRVFGGGWIAKTAVLEKPS